MWNNFELDCYNPNCVNLIELNCYNKCCVSMCEYIKEHHKYVGCFKLIILLFFFLKNH